MKVPDTNTGHTDISYLLDDVGTVVGVMRDALTERLLDAAAEAPHLD